MEKVTPVDFVAVVTGGEIARRDRCTSCDRPMFYRVDSRSGRVLATFCAFAFCAAWLKEKREGAATFRPPRCRICGLVDCQCDVLADASKGPDQFADE